MPYLSLSGIPLTDLTDFRYQPNLMGTKGRAFSGYPFSSVRRTLMTYASTTGPMALAESTVLRALINGDGHSWSFDTGTVSSLGLMPTSTTGTVSASAGSAKYGTGKLSITNGDITWPLTAVEGITYGAWLKAPSLLGGTSWHHLVVRLVSSGDEQVYLDGTLAYSQVPDLESDTAIHFPASGEIFRIGYDSGSDTLLVDDLVFLPYLIPEAWVAHWGAAGAAFGPLPYHRATGDGLHKSSLVLGTAKEGDGLEFFSGGQHVAGESFSFELMEVPA